MACSSTPTSAIPATTSVSPARTPRGDNDERVHQFAWDSFIEATEIAREYGLYGAGQDLLVDAPSGNIRGAGPAVAEITFDHDPVKTNPLRPAESFFVLARRQVRPRRLQPPHVPRLCRPDVLRRLDAAPPGRRLHLQHHRHGQHRWRQHHRSERAGRTTTRLPCCCGTTSVSPSKASFHATAAQTAARHLRHPPAQHRRQLHGQGRPGGGGAQSRHLPGARRG